MRTAFKEWAVVVDALGQGAQILIFRKGGISEDDNEFRPVHESFLLFPTQFHQQREGVLPSARARFDQITRIAGDPARVRLEFYAEVAAHHQLDAFSQAETLRNQHIWLDEVIGRRFDWGKEQAIHVLALRVSRLRLPVELPMNSTYAGCKSWVHLETDIDTAGAVPVLSDSDFHKKLGEFQAALQPTFAEKS